MSLPKKNLFYIIPRELWPRNCDAVSYVSLYSHTSVIGFILESNQNKHLENSWLRHLKSELIRSMHFYLPLILFLGEKKKNKRKNQ